MSARIFYTIIVGFGLGVLWRSFFDMGVEFSILLLFLGAVLLGLVFLLKSLSAENLFVIASIALFAVGIGMLRFDVDDMLASPNALNEYLGQEVQITGIVAEGVEKDLESSQVVVDVEEIEGSYVENQVKVLAITGSYVDVDYGDRVKLKGRLEKPENFEGEGGREFKYVSFLAKDGIYYQMFYPRVEQLSERQAGYIKQALFDIKNAFLEKLKHIIPAPESDLLGGITFGAKGPLGEKLEEKFRETGVIHIVVLSGYHVTLVAEGVMGFLSVALSGIWSAVIGSGAVIAFAVMTGASATVVRASIMALLVVLARATGRVYMVMRALFLAAFIMIMYNPYTLVFDPSFQLSFMATFGLIVLSPYFEEVFTFIPKKFNLREVVNATISTQIFILPLLLYMMGELSLVSVPVNLLILVTVPAVMFLGFLTGCLSFLSVLVATPLAYFLYSILAYQLKVVELFSSLPFASVHISYFPAWLALCIYVFYGFVIFVLNRKTQYNSVKS